MATLSWHVGIGLVGGSPIILRRYCTQWNFLVFNSIMNKMIVPFNVLCLSMEFRIFKEVNSSSSVVIHCHENIRSRGEIKSCRKYISHITSWTTKLHVAYLTFMVDKALQSCVLLHHDTTPPPRMNVYLEVDLDSSNALP